MKLITKEVRALLTKNAAATVADPERDTMTDSTVKFFNPCGAATWYISEAEFYPAIGQQGEEARLFGWCDLGIPGCAELGYVMLSDLQRIRGMGGLGIERDLYHSGTLGEAAGK